MDPEVITVSDLIDQDTRSCDRQKINKVFLPFEGEQIFRIPIAKKIHDDVLSWPWKKDQCYLVRSAYHLLLEKKRSQVEGSSKKSSHWKWLWALNVPSKLKMFVWKLCHNGIPIKSGLLRRGINTDLICFMCNEKEETIAHLFLNAIGLRECSFFLK